MKQLATLFGTVALLALASCDAAKIQADTSNSASGDMVTTSAATLAKNGIRVTPFTDSPRFLEARLSLRTPASGAAVPSGAVAFDYDLSNFLLTKMTGGVHAAHMANSQKGQHIHNIVDNEPYTAHYETEFTKNIVDGQHVVLSFLSRSYHESLKHRGAYDLRVITVGHAVPGTPKFDTSAPHLFYSRPKDVYTGKDAERVMLDFYLVNTTLEPGGTQVRATINGAEFMLDQWAPYMMEGLPIGENTVKLELVDASGNLIDGPYNSVTRSFSIQP